MSGIQCLCCRAALRQSIRIKHSLACPRRRTHSFNGIRRVLIAPLNTEKEDVIDIGKLLSKPSWSVRSLLPAASDNASTPTINPSQLHHLLRLSALPQPGSPEEEAEMLRTLQSQLHFVKEIQSVDTTGIEPLQAIRDETEEGIKEITIGMEALKEAFGNEEVKGRNRRPRRKRGGKVDTMDAEDWDVLGTAERKVGKYFVVDSSTK